MFATNNFCKCIFSAAAAAQQSHACPIEFGLSICWHSRGEKIVLGQNDEDSSLELQEEETAQSTHLVPFRRNSTSPMWSWLPFYSYWWQSHPDPVCSCRRLRRGRFVRLEFIASPIPLIISSSQYSPPSTLFPPPSINEARVAAGIAGVVATVVVRSVVRGMSLCGWPADWTERREMIISIQETGKCLFISFCCCCRVDPQQRAGKGKE